MAKPGEGLGVEPGNAHNESKSMNSSEPEEGSSERLGSTVLVRSKSPEKESSLSMEGGPKVAVAKGFGAVLEAGTAA